jgi:uncharacterized protein DUF4254
VTQPRTAEVVAEFRRALGEGDRQHGDALLRLLLELHSSNLAQWQLEDRVRQPSADNATVVAVKRAIDELNTARHHLVEMIDAEVDTAMHQSASAPLSTESPAMVFDRLSVLVIRIHHTERAAASGRSDADAYGARLPILHEQLAQLEEALDAFLGEVRAGTRRFVPYQSLKLYAP